MGASILKDLVAAGLIIGRQLSGLGNPSGFQYEALFLGIEYRTLAKRVSFQDDPRETPPECHGVGQTPRHSAGAPFEAWYV